MTNTIRPEFVKATVDRFHYLHFGFFSFLFSGIVGALVSLATEPISEEKLHRLTFWTRLIEFHVKCNFFEFLQKTSKFNFVCLQIQY